MNTTVYLLLVFLPTTSTSDVWLDNETTLSEKLTNYLVTQINLDLRNLKKYPQIEVAKNESNLDIEHFNSIFEIMVEEHKCEDNATFFVDGNKNTTSLGFDLLATVVKCVRLNESDSDVLTAEFEKNFYTDVVRSGMVSYKYPGDNIEVNFNNLS